MKQTRRTMLTAAGVAAGAVLASQAASAEDKQECKPMIAACGLACSTCPLMKAGKCKGCSSGKDASPEMLKAKPCPVLVCAAMKKIDYCGTGCKGFTKCKKLIGRPYAQSFMNKIASKLNGTK